MRNYGFSILECMLVMAIITLGLLLATPNLQRFSYVYGGKTVVDQLQHILQYARSLAIVQQNVVVVCPSENGLSCSHNWNNGILVLGKNTKKYFKLEINAAVLSLRQSGNTNARLQILPNGLMHANGHFNYRSSQLTKSPQFNLYFNKALRTYLTLCHT